jgi:hypothetical protein
VDSFRTKRFCTCLLNCDRFPPANVGLPEVRPTVCCSKPWSSGDDLDIPVAGNRLLVKSGRNLDR